MSTLKEDIKQVFNDLFKNVTWDIDLIRLFDNPLWYPIYPPKFTFESKPKTGYKNERKCFDILKKHVYSQKKEDVLLVFDLDCLMSKLVNDNEHLRKCVDQIKTEDSIKSGLTTDFILIDKNYGIFLIDSKGDKNDKNKKKATNQGNVFRKIMMNYIDDLKEDYFQILPYYTTDEKDEDFTQTFISRSKKIEKMSDKIFDECVKFLLRLKYNYYGTGDYIIKENNQKHGIALEKYVSSYFELKTIASNDIKKRIIAGPAGCGKTQVIKHKVANLIKSTAIKQELVLILLTCQPENMHSYIDGLSFKGELKQYFFCEIISKKDTLNTYKRLKLGKNSSLEIFISSKDERKNLFKATCNGICYLFDFPLRFYEEVLAEDFNCYSKVLIFIEFFKLDGEFVFQDITIYHDYDYTRNNDSDLSVFIHYLESIEPKPKIQNIYEEKIDEKILELFKFSVILIEPELLNRTEQSYPEYKNQNSRETTSKLKNVLTNSSYNLNFLIDDFQGFVLEQDNILFQKFEKIDHLWITIDLYQLLLKMDSRSNVSKMLQIDEKFTLLFMDKVLRCSKKIFDTIEPIYNYIKMSMIMNFENKNTMDLHENTMDLCNCYKCFCKYVKTTTNNINLNQITQQKKITKKIQLNISFDEFIKNYKDLEIDIKCNNDADGEVRIFPVEYSKSEEKVINELIIKTVDTIKLLLELFCAKSIAVYIDSNDFILPLSTNNTSNIFNTRDRKDTLKKQLKQQPEFRDIYILEDTFKYLEFSAEFDAVVYVVPGVLSRNIIYNNTLSLFYGNKTNPYFFISRAIHDLTIIYVRCDECQNEEDTAGSLANI